MEQIALDEGLGRISDEDVDAVNMQHVVSSLQVSKTQYGRIFISKASGQNSFKGNQTDVNGSVCQLTSRWPWYCCSSEQTLRCRIVARSYSGGSEVV